MIDAVSLYIHTIIFYDRNRTINVRVFTRLSNMRIKASPIVVGHNNTEIFAFSDPPSRKNMFFRALSYMGKCLLLNSFFPGVTDLLFSGGKIGKFSFSRGSLHSWVFLELLHVQCGKAYFGNFYGNEENCNFS